MRVGGGVDRDRSPGLNTSSRPGSNLSPEMSIVAVDHIDRALLVVGVERQARAGRAARRSANIVSCIVAHRRALRRRASRPPRARILPSSHDQRKFARPRDARSPAPFPPSRAGSATHICRPWIGLPAARSSGAGAFGMHDAAARRHPVHFARLDRRRGAEAVAVHDLAVEQIGDGGEPDMRMRPHVEPVAGAELGRPEMVEEDERPDHARARRRQRAAHREAVAEIDRARHHHMRDRVASIASPACGSLPGKKLMLDSLSCRDVASWPE